MPIYKLGSRGPEVKKIQQKLKSLGYYTGPVDADFGGATKAAVEAFQSDKRLDVDGVIGPKTWKKLFGEPIKDPSIAKKPVDYRCLALTGSFETGKGIPDCFSGISGDFDGQGISFGVLQWNFGQDSLQPLLVEMLEQHSDAFKSVLQSQFDRFVGVLQSSKDEIMAFARSIQHPQKHFVYEPWRGMFIALGRTEEFQDIELNHATATLNLARALCDEYQLWSERALSLMFDIKVQNGSISEEVKARIIGGFETLPSNLSCDELEMKKLCMIANRRAEAARPEWVEDVRSRKLCCANGEGIVHGIDYDLEGQFGLRLKPF